MSVIGTALNASPAGPWLKLIKPFWPAVWRVLLLVVVFASGWHFGSSRAKRECSEEKATTASAVVEGMEQMNREVAARDATLQTKETEYVDNLRALEERQRNTPARVVRVCPDPSHREVPGVPGAATGDAAHAGGDAQLQPGAGRDIGPGLKQLVDRADRVVVKCLAQQERSDALVEMSTNSK